MFIILIVFTRPYSIIGRYFIIRRIILLYFCLNSCKLFSMIKFAALSRVVEYEQFIHFFRFFSFYHQEDFFIKVGDVYLTFITCFQKRYKRFNFNFFLASSEAKNSPDFLTSQGRLNLGHRYLQYAQYYFSISKPHQNKFNQCLTLLQTPFCLFVVVNN